MKRTLAAIGVAVALVAGLAACKTPWEAGRGTGYGVSNSVGSSAGYATGQAPCAGLTSAALTSCIARTH